MGSARAAVIGFRCHGFCWQGKGGGDSSWFSCQEYLRVNTLHHRGRVDPARSCFCKQYTHFARIHTRKILPRACGSKFFKLTLQCSLCVSPKHSSSLAHAMFRTLLNPQLTSLSQSTLTSSSLLFSSHWPSTSTPQTALLFKRFPEQSPVTCYEAKARVEVSNTEATPIFVSSRKGSIGL